MSDDTVTYELWPTKIWHMGQENINITMIVRGRTDDVLESQEAAELCRAAAKELIEVANALESDANISGKVH